MKLIFNINRFAKMLRMEILLYQKTYLILLGITLLDFLITIATNPFTTSIVTTSVQQSGTDLKVVSNAMEQLAMGIPSFQPGGAFGLLLYIVPFVLYNFLYHPTQSLTYTMLPASQFEKFLSALVQCVIIVPFGLLAFSLLIAGIADLSGVPIAWNKLNAEGILHDYWLVSVCGMSVAFWGVFWFKQRKLSKTILTVVAMFIVAVIILAHWNHDTKFFDFVLNNVENVNLTNIFYAMTVVFFGAAFLKFPRTQI